jgi:(R,R)-butanediol dehydrogenase / meso-butanediol dehydrogenase / diacetyl reductase
VAAQTMTAAVFEREGQLAVKQVPIPQVGHDDDVLLKVAGVGICGTDVHILSVPPGHPATAGVILGHEYTGEVVATGRGVTHVRVGDRVVVDPTPPCGACAYCRLDQPNMCEHNLSIGVFTNGGMAAYSRVPARAVFPISPDVPMEIAVLAEPVADVLNGMRRAAPQLGETVLVLGAGPIGLLFTMLLRAAGVGDVIVSEPLPLRAERALQCGADAVIDPGREDLAGAVQARAPLGADLVIDAAGGLLADALRAVRKGGRILLFGVNTTAQVNVRQADLTFRELSILGSYIDRATFPQAVRLLERGRIDFRRLITHRLPLPRTAEGIDLLRRGEAIKVVIVPE